MRTMLSLSMLSLLAAGSCHAIGTAITFQGSLEDNNVPANGSYDFQFQVKASGGGSIGPLLTIDNRLVVNGVFTVQLDFGAGVFSGADRNIAMSVRAGDSLGAYTALLPELPLTVTPYALVSANSELADLASDVTDFAIDNSDIAADAVDSVNIAVGAVGAREIATDGVGAAEVAADAVGTSELADDSVGITNLIGANFSGQVTLVEQIAAESCEFLQFAVTGGFELGDLVLVKGYAAVPSNIVIAALWVQDIDVVGIRACNVGTVPQTINNPNISIISIR